MMQTGMIDSWRDSPESWGPLYPLVGHESWMLAATVLFCVGFVVWKFAHEAKIYRREVDELRGE